MTLERSILVYPEPQKSEMQKVAINSYLGGDSGFCRKISSGEYDVKIEISGNVIQVRSYEKPQRLYKGSNLGKMLQLQADRGGDMGACLDDGCDSAVQDEEGNNLDKDRRSKASERRAREKIVRIVNSNFGGCRAGWIGGKTIKFLTLTYAENMEDRSKCYADWVKFVDALEYRVKSKVQYLAVPERQRRGAYHIHALLYCGYIPFKACEEIWSVETGKGCFKLEKAKYPQNAGAYLAKYIGKDFDVDRGDGNDRRKYCHRYWKSEGLRDSTFVVKADSRLTSLSCAEIEGLIGSQCKRKREFEYFGEYTGKVFFTEYTLPFSAARLNLCQVIGDRSRGE